MEDTTPENYAQIQRSALNRTFAEIEELFASKKVAFSEDEVKTILNGEPAQTPHFPVFMFTLGLVKDILDYIDFTIVGIIIVFFFSLFFFIVFFFWSMGKISGGWWKKSLISWLWKRVVIVGLIELFPFVQMVPATAILVLLAHHHETKLAKLINYSLEKFHSAGIGPNARLSKQSRYL